MLRNYLKIAWRNIFRQKFFSLINILGLAVALCAFFLVIQYAGFELSYDRFHEKAEQIYRVNTARYENGREVYHTALSVPNAGPFLEEQFDEVSTYTRLFSLRSNFVCVVSYTDDTGTISFNERNAYYGDENFFKVFSYPLLAGDKASILTEPFTYYFINRWLEQYAYHISPDWWMFGLPALMVLFSAIIVVIGQAMKSALTNPAESLRNE